MVFVDTGAFLARYVARDQFHAEAVKQWKDLGARRWPCFTSSFVLAEVFTLLARRTEYRFAVMKAREIHDSDRLTILRPGEEEEAEAINWFEKYADQEVSFVDCLSFALMKRKRLKRVFGFDAHFDRAGFRRFP